MIFVMSSFSKISVFKMFYFHIKTANPAFPNSSGLKSVFVTNYCERPFRIVDGLSE